MCDYPEFNFDRSVTGIQAAPTLLTESLQPRLRLSGKDCPHAAFVLGRAVDLAFPEESPRRQFGRGRGRGECLGLVGKLERTEVGPGRADQVVAWTGRRSTHPPIAPVTATLYLAPPAPPATQGRAKRAAALWLLMSREGRFLPFFTLRLISRSHSLGA